jgi:hypothetical protein
MMAPFTPFARFKKLVRIALVSTLLAGCNLSEDKEFHSLESQEVSIQGSVGDGPVTGAIVTVFNRDGLILSAEISDEAANFRLQFKTRGNDYPLMINAVAGTDLVTNMEPDITLLSVATSKSQKTVNLNPYSTMITKAASLMDGGLTDTNIDFARNAILRNFNFGLDVNLVPDPVNSNITPDNVAIIIKASETMGEMIRRSRDVMLTLGEPVTGDDIVAAIAADLVDGVVDGMGASGTDPRIAAVANVVSGQVLIEAMSNNLRVNGGNATDAMDNAIRITQPSAPVDATTGNVRISPDMLVQARAAIRAAQAISPSISLSTIDDILNSLQDYSLPADVEPLLPGDTSADLNEAIQTTAIASDSQLETMNTEYALYVGSVSVGSATSGGGSTGSNSGWSSTGTGDQTPVANNDTATTGASTPVNIPVLDNDENLANLPIQVSFVTRPSNGGAVVNSDNTITYTPDAGYSGTESFAYKLVDGDGDIATANVTINVACSSNCSTDVQLTLSWDPSAGDVEGYRVYYGNSPQTTDQMVSDVAATSVTYSASNLGASAGDNVCFQVRAYNALTTSAPSDAVCGTL